MIPSTRLKITPLVETMGMANLNHFVKRGEPRRRGRCRSQRAKVKVRPMVQELTSFSSSRD